MEYSIYKSLHLIFMVSYFAGLFYLVRLIVYYKDTDTMEPITKDVLREQYVFMMRRLWNIIIVPALCIMAIFGVLMIFNNLVLLESSWFQLKLALLMVLFLYHYWSWSMVRKIKNLQNKDIDKSNLFLRQMNEIATFLLFAIIFTVILKQQLFEYFWQLIVGFISIVVLIFVLVKTVNRNKKI